MIRGAAGAALIALCGAAPAAQPPAPPALPSGAGRDVVARVCSQCHSLETVIRAHLSRPQWEARLDAMIGKGAKLSDEDFDEVARYLATNFGPSAAP